MSRTGETLRVTFASELRVQVTPDGRVWAASGFGHDYWSTLLGVETRATLLARSESVGSTPEVTDRVDGPLVNVVCLPPIRPGRNTLANSMSALRTMWSLEPDGALLLIMPGTVASLALVIAILRRRSFCVWVVGDPIDVAFKAGVGGPGGKLAGLLLAGTTRLACRRAAVVSYVTSEYLQQRYPPGPQSTSLSLSSARLGGELHSAVRAWERPVARIATVGSLAQRYKRVDLLLEALAWLRAEGWDLQLDVVGGGRLLPELVSQAKVLGIDGWTTFHGAVPQTKVRSVLANADLFVLCSDTEGLPRRSLKLCRLGCRALVRPSVVFPSYSPLSPVSSRVPWIRSFRRCVGSSLAPSYEGRVEHKLSNGPPLTTNQRERRPCRPSPMQWPSRAEVETMSVVVHLFGSMDRGGAEMRALELVRQRLRPGEHHVFMALSGRKGALDEEFRSLNSEVMARRLSPTFPLWFIAELRRRRPTHLHSHVHLASGYLLLLGWLARVPRRIAHFHSIGDGRASNAARRAYRTIGLVLVHLFATDVVAVSHVVLGVVSGSRRRRAARFDGAL